VTPTDLGGEILKDLSRQQCMRLLPTVRVGRVGIGAGGPPLILPVNFVFLDESVVFRTVPGTKLAAATAQAAVTFEADNFAADGAWGWSVLIHGIASEIATGPERDSLRVALLRAWAFRAGTADRIVRIDPTAITGRGFGHAVQALAPPHGQRTRDPS
jgi:uncharacterized protein